MAISHIHLAQIKIKSEKLHQSVSIKLCFFLACTDFSRMVLLTSNPPEFLHTGKGSKSVVVLFVFLYSLKKRRIRDLPIGKYRNE